MITVTASTINEIINHVLTDTFFKGYCYSLVKSKFMWEELFQEFCLKICEEPLDKMLMLFNSGQFNYYCAAIIKNMIANKYSAINKNFNNTNLELNENIEVENIENEQETNINQEEAEKLIKEINDYLQKTSDKTEGFWYDKKLWELYFYNDNTFRSIGEMTTIPYPSIFHSITNTKKIIINKFYKKYIDIKNK